jgi:hypothetical protein
MWPIQASAMRWRYRWQCRGRGCHPRRAEPAGRPMCLTITWPGAVLPAPAAGLGTLAGTAQRNRASDTHLARGLGVGLFPGRAPGRFTCPREPHLHLHGLVHWRGGRNRRLASTGSAASAPANYPPGGRCERERTRGDASGARSFHASEFTPGSCGGSCHTDWHPGSRQATVKCPQMARSGCSVWAPAQWHCRQDTSTSPGPHSCPFSHRLG